MQTKVWLLAISSVLLFSQPLFAKKDAPAPKAEESTPAKAPSTTSSTTTTKTQSSSETQPDQNGLSVLEKVMWSYFYNGCIEHMTDLSQIEKFAARKKLTKRADNTKDANIKSWVVYEDDISATRISLVINDQSCMVSGVTTVEGMINTHQGQTPLSEMLTNQLKATGKNSKTEGNKVLNLYSIKYKDQDANVIYSRNTVPLRHVQGFAYTSMLAVRAVK
jgi:hypothetical protein